MIEGKTREQKRLIKEIDRQTCIARIHAVMKDSGYKYFINESKVKADLSVFVDDWHTLWFSFKYEGAAESNQTEHLLEDIKTIMEINGRYYDNPFLTKNSFIIADWNE